MADKKISDDVAAVLRRSTVNGNTLKLPPALPRALYDEVNTVLNNAGGKWNRKAEGHVFPGDPMKKLGLALETGVSTDFKKKFQAFYTPATLADRIAEMAQCERYTVLEPSAGGGALVRACLDRGATKVKCIELDHEAADALRQQGLDVHTGDFLNCTPPGNNRMKFDRIVMNPPFTRGQDLKHVAHAIEWLAPGGRLVAIIGPKDDDTLEALAAGNYWEVTEPQAGLFKDSGTNVAVQILTIGKTS